jgi:hypothetical protein
VLMERYEEKMLEERALEGDRELGRVLAAERDGEKGAREKALDELVQA